MIKRGFNEKNKKADMTSTQIVTIILLIAGFAIVLFLLWRFNFSGQINRTACHQSVIIRATLPDIVKDMPSLKCYTRKVCITDKLFGKGDCQEFSGGSFDTIRVLGTTEQIRTKINVFLAREMADCWSMMGEGKVQVFARESLESNKCSLCSRIAFDASLKQKLNNNIKGTVDYLVNHKVSGKEVSYSKFLFNNLNSVGLESVKDNFDMTEKAILFKEFDINKIASWTLGTSGAVAGAVLIGGFVSGGSIPLTLALYGGGSVLGGTGGYAGGESLSRFFSDAKGADYIASNPFVDYEKTKIETLKCDSFESIA